MKIKKYKYPMLKKKIWQSVSLFLASILLWVTICFLFVYFNPLPTEDNTLQVQGKCIAVTKEDYIFDGTKGGNGHSFIYFIILDSGVRYQINKEALKRGDVTFNELETLCLNNDVTIRYIDHKTWLTDAYSIEELSVSSQTIYSLSDSYIVARNSHLGALSVPILTEMLIIFFLVLNVITTDDYDKWSDRRTQRKKLLAREKEKARKAELKAQAKNNKTG